MRLFPSCLKAREFEVTHLLTSMDAHSDPRCGYLVLLTLRWPKQVDSLHSDQRSENSIIFVLFLLC